MTTATVNNVRYTFIRGRAFLSKHVHHNGIIDTFPLVNQISSVDLEFPRSLEGLKKLAQELPRFGKDGQATHIGPFVRQLANESRRNMVKKDAPLSKLILDIDGVSLPGLALNSTAIDKNDVEAMAEIVVSHLPEAFHDTSYVALASSSCGLKGADRANVHLHFFLSHDLTPRSASVLLQSLNLDDGFFESRISLTGSSSALNWPIDPVTSQNSRIIYIAPPTFDDVNDDPFKGVAGNRIALHEGAKDVLDVRTVMPSISDIEKKKRVTITNLRNIAGLPGKKNRFSSIKVTGLDGTESTTNVLVNPDKRKMEYYSETDEYVRYDIEGGDSHAYWVYKHAPGIVYSFKPEEYPLSFEAIDPDTYKWHVDNYVVPLKNCSDSPFIPPVPVVFLDYLTDCLYKMLVTPGCEQFHVDDITRAPVLTNMTNAKQFMEFFGAALPDPIPQWDYRFDPTDDTVIDVKKRFVNKFMLPPLMSVEPLDELKYKSAKDLFGYAQEHCPWIARTILSVCGDDITSCTKFLEWLAYIFQHRSKTQTAWIFHGTHGTGKGLLYNSIMRPLFTHYVTMVTMRQFEDMDNSWAASTLIACVDEFRLFSSSNPESIENALKNMITEPTTQIRKLYSSPIEVPSYLNLILFSNEHDSIRLDPNDRRYSVAPRQENPLAQRYPNWRDGVIQGIESELGLFARGLGTIEVNEVSVRTPLLNAAKEELRKAAATSEGDFFAALQSGDLEYFTDNIMIDKRGDSILNLSAAEVVLKRWLRDARSNQPLFAPLEDVLDIRNAILSMGRPINMVQLGKSLSRRGFETVRRSLGTVRKRGIDITIGLAPDKVHQLQRAYLTDIDFPQPKLVTIE